ncbi:Crp/Fnr family transcriptional regulator [Pseudoalteromonas sp. DL2-H2.2]|uniref:Crp/Fnr family transcriptional regulator n=1 Tax=Pseudoalteromonas sp. DL2-H2.2 TaxID=2908889 RepID=UPI001F219B72|nr:Crp/Fnr family transcriptional regulator [Pseudoalteromonas sp. DL2-H2.2]MCF2908495.1 Crp/Fnr family transcriptional regulator [Pseudoalteromonas sp. DL2-H2.2]
MDMSHFALLHTILNQVSALDQSLTARLAHAMHIQHYPANATIFACGDTVKSVSFLLDGIGRYFYLDSQGNERNKSLVQPGGAFTSVSSLVTGCPSPFATQAITHCTTAKIHYSTLLELSEQHVEVATFVRRLYERLVIKKEQREAAFLMQSATERYQAFLLEFSDTSHQIPLRQVAMYLGITDVALSRIRNQMGLT